MTEPGRYTSGRIAVANLSASIEALEQRRVEGASFDDLVALSKLLLLRGDLLGRIAFRNGNRRKLAHHGSFGIGVHHDWRGRGVGTALISALLDWASAHPTL